MADHTHNAGCTGIEDTSNSNPATASPSPTASTPTTTPTQSDAATSAHP